MAAREPVLHRMLLQTELPDPSGAEISKYCITCLLAYFSMLRTARAISNIMKKFIIIIIINFYVFILPVVKILGMGVKN